MGDILKARHIDHDLTKAILEQLDAETDARVLGEGVEGQPGPRDRILHPVDNIDEGQPNVSPEGDLIDDTIGGGADNETEYNLPDMEPNGIRLVNTKDDEDVNGNVLEGEYIA